MDCTGEVSGNPRILRVVKKRFDKISEIEIFEICEEGPLQGRKGVTRFGFTISTSFRKYISEHISEICWHISSEYDKLKAQKEIVFS